MSISLIAALIISSVFALAWFALSFLADDEDYINAAYNAILSNKEKIARYQKKERENREKLASYQGLSARLARLFIRGSYEKKKAGLEKKNAFIQNNAGRVGLFVLPGYVLQRKIAFFGRGTAYKKLMIRHIELYGKKYAERKTRGVIAEMLSFAIIGVALVLALGALLTARGASMGILVLVVGTLIVLTLSYSVYDKPRSEVAKRREAISRQIPNVVSKLALLVSSGMIMNQAWRQTALSGEGVIYTEMLRTADELDNLVSPEAAFTGFITRCNTKETSKLASAILQNIAKGNAEIAYLLRDLAREAWLERRHLAKREAEKAGARLIIPVMMLFAVIMLMILVPIVMSLNTGFGA